MTVPVTSGTLIGVSLGPGDPELITRAAWAQLQRRDAVWVYPARSTKTPSYAFDIAQRAGLTPPAEHQALLFPMTHDAEKLLRHWQRAAETVLPWLQAGRDVLFLVEGDASTYATFGHLARTVQVLAPGLPVRTLAGVNAFTAACARLGRPLSEQDDTVAIVPAAYGVAALDRLLPEFDTLVLLKVKPLIEPLFDWLIARDLLAGPDGVARPPVGRESAHLAVVLHLAAAGVWGLRVHDVRATCDALAAWERLSGPGASDRPPPAGSVGGAGHDAIGEGATRVLARHADEQDPTKGEGR